MVEQSIVISGLPHSGKTTFLAALWHVIFSREITTKLSFHSLQEGDSGHLDSIRDRWLSTKTQLRTEQRTEHQEVTINLTDENEQHTCVVFPDLSGELFTHMWEARECSLPLNKLLKNGSGLMVFINACTIRAPLSILDLVAQSKDLGIEISSGEYQEWHPKLAPTQVKLVDLIQLFRMSPLNVDLKKIAIVLTAWDKASIEGKSPEDYLSQHLPLLAQYLECNLDQWDWKIYGISAQGGDYLDENKEPSDQLRKSTTKLQELNTPTERIKVVSNGVASHDLTEPLAWLMH